MPLSAGTRLGPYEVVGPLPLDQALRPVTFYYKPEFDDGPHVQQYGLIAEEVEKVMPGLVAYDNRRAAGVQRPAWSALLCRH